MQSTITCIHSLQEQFAKSRSHISEWIKQIEYLKQKYADAKVLFPGHGQYDAAKMGGERTTANITEGGKILIKSD
jgi:hypothetical protein